MTKEYCNLVHCSCSSKPGFTVEFHRVDLFFWWNRLSTTEELAKAMNKKLTQGMAEHNKAMAAAKTEEEKETIVRFSNPLKLL